jgi:DNA-binding transcriptional LysR family regulator
MHGLAELKESKGEPAKERETTLTGSAALINHPIRVGLKDWRVLHAVVDCGTFASAAIILNMSQPAVSYTLAKLAEQIGIPLFRQEGRKACITPMGRALVERTRGLIREAYEVEEFAANLMKTWKQDIRLAVEKDFPMAWLAKALRHFAEHHVNVNVHLSEESASAIEKGLLQRTVDIAITSRVPNCMEGALLAQMEMSLVANPKHALLHLGRDLHLADLEREVRVKTEPESTALPLCEFADQPMENADSTWTVHNFDAAMSLIEEGLGYGWMPTHKVAELLANGKLAVVPWHLQDACTLRFYLIHRHNGVPKLEIRHLSAVLHSVIEEKSAHCGKTRSHAAAFAACEPSRH